MTRAASNAKDTDAHIAAHIDIGKPETAVIDRP
jgi:hypothetical protein